MSERVECDHCGRGRGTEADFDCESCNVHVHECPACAVLCWRSMGGDCADPDWMRRCLAAEQRAEAAEAERDRMRAVVEAAGAFMPALHISPGDSGAMRGVWMRHGYDDAGLALSLRDAIDAYRAGQPATSKADKETP